MRETAVGSRDKPESGRISLRHRIEYALYLSFRTAARLIGEWGLNRLGSVVGALGYRVVRRRTELAARNLALVYPNMSSEERDRIVRECWRHYARETIRYVRDTGVEFQKVADRFEVVGRENMEQAVSTGRGVILLSAHFGSWESAVSVLELFGRKVVIVGRRLDNPLLQQQILEGRTRSGFELLDRRSAARELIRALKEKAIIVLLVDQSVRDSEGEMVPFMGHDAWTTTSPARLGLKYECPILNVFTYPAESDRKERIEFEQVIDVTGLDEAGVMKRVNEDISKRIDADPHLWLWFHDRWKGVPR